jgi:ABC-type glycerol-3-phosphate transport system substrate-binding protein
MPVSRRTALAALGLAALGPLAGCGDELRGTVRVGVVWSGSELATFRRVLRDFTTSQLWGVSVVSLGDDVGTLLAGRVARAVAPDVAVLPWPGLVAAASAQVQELPNLTPPGVSPGWRALASPGGGPPRGVWYKATHKSLVWYRPDVFRRYRVEPPTDWAGWRELRETFAARGLAPLSIGAADGWVLTDWFENVLWGLDHWTYGQLAAGKGAWDSSSVVRTLELLAEVWTPAGTRTETLPGGPGRSLLVQFEDSVLDVAQRDRAAMVLGADFVLPVVRRLAPKAPPLDWFPVPAPPGGVAPVVVGGDLAVLLAGAGEGGLTLVKWLARADAARAWAAAGGFVSLRPDVTEYPDQYRPELLGQVRNGAPSGLGFDLSDQLAGSSLAGGDGRGLWRLLQRFLAELGRGGEAGRVIDDTVRQLVAAATVER